MSETMTPIEAAALVEADKQRRIKLASEAVQATLSQHGCELVAVPQITPEGRVVAVIVMQLVTR